MSCRCTDRKGKMLGLLNKHVLVTAGTCFSLVSVPGFWSMCAKMLQLLVCTSIIMGSSALDKHIYVALRDVSGLGKTVSIPGCRFFLNNPWWTEIICIFKVHRELGASTTVAT